MAHTDTGSLEELTRGKAWGFAAWFAGTFVLGIIGWREYEQLHHGSFWLPNTLYHTAQMFILHTPHLEGHLNWKLETARWSAAGLTLVTAIRFGRHLLHRESSARRLERMKDHVLICGLGRKGFEAALCHRGRKQQVVAIERNPTPEIVEACRKAGIELVVGDVCSPTVLKSAGVARASQLVAMCSEDSTNCEIAVQALQIRSHQKPGGKSLHCEIHLSDSQLRTVLQRTPAMTAPHASVALKFIDVFDSSARNLLLKDLPIDQDGISPAETRRVRLVIIGFGRMGTSLAIRAAKLGHFANGQKLMISVIERGAAAKESAFLFRFPKFREAADITFECLESESPECHRLIESWCSDKNWITNVAVCFDNEARAVEIALQLLPLLASNGVPMAIRLARRSGLARLLELPPSGSDLRHFVRPFGMLEDSCGENSMGDPVNEKLAQTIHEHFVARQKRAKPGRATENALSDWTSLPEDFKESNRQQADHIQVKLKSAGLEAVPVSDPRPAVPFDGEENKDWIESLSKMEHARWNAERWLAGWIHAEAPKDEIRRTSPYLVEWEKLSDEVKDYDRDTVRSIPEFLAAIGQKVCRREVK